MFYLAQSYFDSQQWEKSIEAYQKRVDAGGWPEEVYYSKLRIAILKGLINKPQEEIAEAFLDCYNTRPTRAEPLWFLSRMYRNANKPAVAYLYARMGLEIPYPDGDILFIQDDVYRWGLLDEIGATAFYANHPHVGYEACKRLLENNLIPETHIPRVRQNFKSYEGVLKKINANKEAQKMMEKDSKKQNKLNKNKKSTRVPKRKGFKKR